MKMPTEAQMRAWERHVEESKRREAARARPGKGSGKKEAVLAPTADGGMPTVHEEDGDYVLL
jgi:hypothetical protein